MFDPTIKRDRIIHVYLYSLQWARFSRQFGKRHEKHLPKQYMCHDPRFTRGLLDGLVDSDGYVDSGGRICFRNTSERLVELFGILCFFMHGSFPSVVRERGSAGGLDGTTDDRCRDTFKARLDSTI